MIYYKHYMGDYQRHTGHLSLAQDGAYRRMMDHYYSTEDALPAERSVLYRICGALEKAEREAVDYVAKSFFEEHNGRLHHQRIDEEIAIAQEKIANLKANAKSGGKQSGRTRKAKAEAEDEANDEANASADANNTNSQSQSKANALEKTNAPLALPEWLSPDDWQRFVAYRRKASGKKFTAEAEKLNLTKLCKLYADGNDPVEVLEQTIANGWSGLFEVKKARASPPGGYESAKDRSRREASAKLTGRTSNDERSFIDIN